MNLKQEFLQDLKQAMQTKNTLKKDTVTMLRAAILQIEKDDQKELTENEILQVVSKEIKKRKESIPDFEKGGRHDLVTNIQEEINILSKYLPEQLSVEKIRIIVQKAVNTTQATSMKDMGKVMTSIKDEIAGKADGKVVSDIVKEILNK